MPSVLEPGGAEPGVGLGVGDDGVDLESNAITPAPAGR